MYVVIDGIDGAGKTTVINDLSKKLREQGLFPVCLVEPSFGVYGRKVRKRFESTTPRDIAIERELFTLDRVDHVKSAIAPLLKFSEQNPKFIILQDRGYLSYPAYQAEHEGELDEMRIAHKMITPTSDLMVILDLPAEIAINRIKHKRHGTDNFEKLQTLSNAKLRYLLMVKKHEGPNVIINANQEIDKVVNDILNEIIILLGGKE